MSPTATLDRQTLSEIERMDQSDPRIRALAKAMAWVCNAMTTLAKTRPHTDPDDEEEEEDDDDLDDDRYPYDGDDDISNRFSDYAPDDEIGIVDPNKFQKSLLKSIDAMIEKRLKPSGSRTEPLAKSHLQPTPERNDPPLPSLSERQIHGLLTRAANAGLCPQHVPDRYAVSRKADPTLLKSLVSLYMPSLQAQTSKHETLALLEKAVSLGKLPARAVIEFEIDGTVDQRLLKSLENDPQINGSRLEKSAVSKPAGPPRRDRAYLSNLLEKAAIQKKIPLTTFIKFDVAREMPSEELLKSLEE